MCRYSWRARIGGTVPLCSRHECGGGRWRLDGQERKWLLIADSTRDGRRRDRRGQQAMKSARGSSMPTHEIGRTRDRLCAKMPWHTRNMPFKEGGRCPNAASARLGRRLEGLAPGSAADAGARHEHFSVGKPTRRTEGHATSQLHRVGRRKWKGRFIGLAGHRRGRRSPRGAGRHRRWECSTRQGPSWGVFLQPVLPRTQA